MKAFLLAAGIGSRLRPITDTIPKCMLVIDDRPLLDIWLDAFDRAGVDEVLVNLHHLPEVVTTTSPHAPGRLWSVFHSSRNCSAAPVRSAPTDNGSTAKTRSWRVTRTILPTLIWGHLSAPTSQNTAIATLVRLSLPEPVSRRSRGARRGRKDGGIRGEAA